VAVVLVDPLGARRVGPDHLWNPHAEVYRELAVQALRETRDLNERWRLEWPHLKVQDMHEARLGLAIE
jgi:hypothetical protein